MDHEAEVRAIEAAMRSEGWADVTSLDRQLREWRRLADEAADYPLTVDDYTNDLCSRDYLADVAARASRDLRHDIEQQIAPIDEIFRRSTVDDVGGRLGQHYRMEDMDGWWWRRRPPAGSLAEYLRAD